MDVNDPGWLPENWHKERRPLTSFWRRMVWPLRKILAIENARRLATLRDRFLGKRAFLLGNAPSLAKLNLAFLKDEHVVVVNRGLRAIDQGLLPHADMHLMSSKPGYLDFREEIEDQCIRHAVALRFYRQKLGPLWRELPNRGEQPHFTLRRAGTMLTTGFQTDIMNGIGSDGTILLYGVQILYFLGFSEVYVLGCDLEYDPANKYFYEMTDKDHAHEADPGTIAARASLVRGNAQFEIARTAYEADGRLLANAGVGGNLTALKRVDFNSLFENQSSSTIEMQLRKTS